MEKLGELYNAGTIHKRSLKLIVKYLQKINFPQRIYMVEYLVKLRN